MMKFKTLETIEKYACDIDLLKSNLRKTDDSQDNYLYSLIKTATKKAENYIGKQIVRSKILGFCPYVGKIQYEINRGANIVIEKVELVLIDGTTLTLDSAYYESFVEELDAYLFIKSPDKLANVSRTHPAAIQITFSAGWDGTELMPFPEDIVNASAMKATRMYMNPDDGVDEKTTASENLLKPYRCPIL